MITIFRKSVTTEFIFYQDIQLDIDEKLILFIKNNTYYKPILNSNRLNCFLSKESISEINERFNLSFMNKETVVNWIFCGKLG